MQQITLLTPETLAVGETLYPCQIGKNGFIAASEKREGDGATPMGKFFLRGGYFRSDRIAIPPRTALPLRELSRADGWCDDPAHPQYNQPVKLPFSGSHEALWRRDHAYDLIIPLGWNDAPVVAGKGSAIFLHCAHDDGRPTAGCIALHRADLLEILPLLSVETMLLVAAM